MKKNCQSVKELCDKLLTHNYSREPLPLTKSYFYDESLNELEIEITLKKLHLYFDSKESFLRKIKAKDYIKTENGTILIKPEKHPLGEP